jgi:hypothetical protein
MPPRRASRAATAAATSSAPDVSVSLDETDEQRSKRLGSQLFDGTRAANDGESATGFYRESPVHLIFLDHLRCHECLPPCTFVYAHSRAHVLPSRDTRVSQPLLSRFADGPLKQLLSGPATMAESSEEEKYHLRVQREVQLQSNRTTVANDRRIAAKRQERDAVKEVERQDLLSRPSTDIGKEYAGRAEKVETEAEEAERTAKKARVELRGQVAGPYNPHILATRLTYLTMVSQTFAA